MWPISELMAFNGVHILNTMDAALTHGLGGADVGNGTSCVALHKEFQGEQQHSQSNYSECYEQ